MRKHFILIEESLDFWVHDFPFDLRVGESLAASNFLQPDASAKMRDKLEDHFHKVESIVWVKDRSGYFPQVYLERG